MRRQQHFMIWSMAFYFGWILSFPYFGQVLETVALKVGIGFRLLTLSFILFHAVGFLIGAISLKNTLRWKQLMVGSLVAVLTISLSLWFLPHLLWIPAMALTGFVSTFYILGWGCLLANYPTAEKVKIYLNFIIRANLIVIIMICLNTILSPAALYYASIVPLILALVVLIVFSPNKHSAIQENLVVATSPTAIYLLVLIFFIILLNFTLGFVYTVVNKSYFVIAGNAFAINYFRFVPYLLPYLVILNLGRAIELKHLIYIAVSLMGLGYVSYILLGDSALGYYLTITIIQAGYALIALFVWLLIGNLSTRYTAPYLFFSYGLFAILLGSFLGGYLGDYLLKLGSTTQLITSLSAIAAIFLSLLAVPWLLDGAEEYKSAQAINFSDVLLNSDHEFIEEFFRQGKLTAREIEIVNLLMQGLSNKRIAELLYISEDTLKTHLRNIYRKYGVHKKSELLALIASKYFTSTQA